MSLRTRLQLIQVGYHMAVPAICLAAFQLSVALGNEGAAQAFGLALAIHALTFRRMPVGRWLQQAVVRRQRCPGCYRRIELEAPWHCGCGLTSHPRHALSRCPGCHRGFAWVECYQCGTGMRV